MARKPKKTTAKRKSAAGKKVAAKRRAATGRKAATRRKAAARKQAQPHKRPARGRAVPRRKAAKRPLPRRAPPRRAPVPQAALGPFRPPPASRNQVQGVPFDRAVDFAPAAKARFDRADAQPGNRDPSKCKALLRFPDSGGNPGAVFWSAKMAIDTDGPAAGPGRLDGKQIDPDNGAKDTSMHLANGDGLPAETVPYIVLPHVPGDTSRPFDPAVALGDVAVVIFGDKITAAVCGDIGPAAKIGEASIRVHEKLEQPGVPDPCVRRDSNGFCLRARNASVGQDVLYFVFPGSAFPRSELTLDSINGKVEERALRLFDQLRGMS